MGRKVALFGCFLVMLAIAPAVAANTASPGLRMKWVFFILLLATVGAIASSAQKPVSRPDWAGPYSRRFAPYVWLCAALLFILAEIGAVAIGYVPSNEERVWSAARGLSAFIGAVVPSVGKLATSMIVEVQPEVTIKAQTIMSLLIMAAALTTCIFAVFWICMPAIEKKRTREIGKMLAKPQNSNFDFLVILFGILIGLGTFVGWGEFGELSSPKFCLLEAICYIQYDLDIIAAAHLKIMGMIFFPVGSIFVLKKHLDPKGEASKDSPESTKS
jgi:hypothetical protein